MFEGVCDHGKFSEPQGFYEFAREGMNRFVSRERRASPAARRSVIKSRLWVIAHLKCPPGPGSCVLPLYWGIYRYFSARRPEKRGSCLEVVMDASDYSQDIMGSD